MAKTFYTSGTGSQQTLTGSQNEKVAIYQTLADAEADLANLEAGQIVATPDTGDENAQPVDVIQSGNMHAVTSNAVAGAMNNPITHDFPSYDGNDRIFHLGTFNNPNNDNYNGAVVELEMNRADRVNKVIAVVSNGRIEFLGLTAETLSAYQSEIRLYKTSNNVYDLYLLAKSWTQNNFVKITSTRNFTYDGSLVSSYIGTQVTPSRILSTLDVANSVTGGNTNPVSSGAVASAISVNAFKMVVPSPGAVEKYVKIGIKNYDKTVNSVFIAFNCFSMWGVIREGSQCFYRGTQYGVYGVSYPTYNVDNDSFFWIRINNYRTIDFISTRELYIMETTTTAPSGVTFTSPVQWT